MLSNIQNAKMYYADSKLKHSHDILIIQQIVNKGNYVPIVNINELLLSYAN